MDDLEVKPNQSGIYEETNYHHLNHQLKEFNQSRRYEATSNHHLNHQSKEFNEVVRPKSDNTHIELST